MSCVRDSDGAVQVFVAQVVDVTELIAARDASRGATTAHEALVSVLTDMIYRGRYRRRMVSPLQGPPMRSRRGRNNYDSWRRPPRMLSSSPTATGW